MPLKNVVSECRSRMSKTLNVLQSDLRSIRAGRASTGLVENLSVDYYGSPTPLKQLANLAAPQADTIMIKPFDPGCVKDIEKAIKASDLSIAPLVEGKFIRLNIPPLSEERRQQLVTQVKGDGEQAKVGIRNVRRDSNKQLEKEQKEKVLTEDDLEKGKKQINDITKEFTDKIDQTVDEKSAEIMSD